MCKKSHCALLALANVMCAYAQLRPDNTTLPAKPPAPKPAQIIIQTSPNAQVYLDDVFKGQASPQGRLVIDNAKAGDHDLRVSLAGKQNHEQKVTVTAGQVTKIMAPLADAAGTLVVQTSPGAAVFLDGSSRGTADARGQLSIPDVAAGSHELRVAAAGKSENRRNISVSAGQLSRVEAPLANLTGTLVVHSSPGAAVFLDASIRGITDASGQLADPEVAAGSHELWISAKGKKEYRQIITVAAGQEARVEARLEDAGPTPPGTVRENPKDGLKYVWIPPGTFMMGCSPGENDCFASENPSHRVTITKGFWFGQTKVTVGAYKRFAAATGRQMSPVPALGNRLLNPGWRDDAMPIVVVTWDEARAYCGWAGGRLPTEAEWEYAARAGSTASRYGDLDEIAWYANNSGNQRLDAAAIMKEDAANYLKHLSENGNVLHEVGQKRANGFGLYDILGSVWEWVNDWYDQDYYQNSPSQDPSGPASGQERVLRGGSMCDIPETVHVSYRYRFDPAVRYGTVGVRCAREVDIP